MTREEHLLMVGLIANQLQTLRTLCTILNSRGVLEDGDLAAFHQWTINETGGTDNIIDHAKGIYRSIANPLNVDIPEGVL
jgi:hypothetical protein